MDDFEYSVEIGERDWECFFAECEACNLLPPSLAGVDDSGMSDYDVQGSILATRAQKVDLTAGLSEADGAPDCEDSPVEHYLSNHGVGKMQSVLSGSEEDIHLQTVNIFFERLKNVAEPERPVEPGQVSADQNREAGGKEERCGDGKRASGVTLPKNTPKLNALPSRGEAAVGKGARRPVDTPSKISTMKTSNEKRVSSIPAASNSGFEAHKSVYPETELFIREEACTEPRVNEATRRDQFHDITNGGVYPETTPQADPVTKFKRGTPLKDAGQKCLWTSRFTFSERCNIDSPTNVELATNGDEGRGEQTPLFQSDAMSLDKPASQESSPCASTKRKRRKKRRLGSEPPDGTHGYERRVFFRPSDSEEEQRSGRAGPPPCSSEHANVLNLSEPQQHVASSFHAVTNDFPVRPSAQIKASAPPHAVPRSVAEMNAAESLAPLSQRGDNVTSATRSRGKVATHLQPRVKLQAEELVEHTLSRRTAEVGSITVLPSAEPSDPAVGASQDHNLSHAKSEAGNPSRADHELCRREAESQQQLEVDCRDPDQFSAGLVKARALHTTPQPFRTRACPLSTEESSSEVARAELTSGHINPSPYDTSLRKSDSNLDTVDTVQQTEGALQVQTLPESAQLAASQSVATSSTCASGEFHLTCCSQREMKMSSSKDLTSPSDMTSVSSCSTLRSHSMASLSLESISDLSGSSSSSVSQSECVGVRGDINALITAKPNEENVQSESKSQIVSNDSKSDFWGRAEEAVASSNAEFEPKKAPDSKHSVFAMSSFWSEMEKLTINDILDLRTISKAAPSLSLSPLLESQETDTFATPDSGSFAQLEESKTQQTNRYVSSLPEAVASSSVPIPTSHDIYPENIRLTPVSDLSQPFLSGSAQKSLRKISKSVSVHNLHALDPESLSSAWTGRRLQTSEEGQSETVDFFPREQTPERVTNMDSSPSSLKDSYRISVADVFQYLFGGKPSPSVPSAADQITSSYAEGDSVPETYDHFFSEFDTESFFCPLITADDHSKDGPVPIFSYSRSAGGNLQFPEAYDCLFTSSSDDESEDEDKCRRVRVVTRFSPKAATSQLSTDIYEHFYTDSDIQQNFFWKTTTLSFRNITFSGLSVRPQALSNAVSHAPVRQSGRSLPVTVYPSSVLGNQDVMFADRRLCHLEDRRPIQQAQKPFRYEHLQTAVPNPRLETPFLPLRQSDMCLVCIAFASWVLKTANPEVGDTWKAVLLANVSALSAIRYLRRYVKMKAADGERRLLHTTPSESGSLCL